MSVATKPTEQHGAKAHSDGGWDSTEGAFVPVQTRSERFTSFDTADFAAVTGREVEWKLTPVDRVARASSTASSTARRTTVDADGRRGIDVELGRPRRRRASARPATRRNVPRRTRGRTSSRRSASLRPASERVERRRHAREPRRQPRAAHTRHHGAPNATQRTSCSQRAATRSLSENVEIIVGDGAHLTVVSRAGVGRRRRCTSRATSPASDATPSSRTSSSRSAGGRARQPVGRTSPARAPRPNCTASSSPTPASTSSSRSTCTTTRRTRAARHLQGCAAGRGRAHRLDRRRADRTGRRRHRLLRAEPQPRADRRHARRLDPEPRDRDRRHPRCRPRQRDGTIRRRAALLPAGARHQRRRGAPPRRLGFLTEIVQQIGNPALEGDSRRDRDRAGGSRDDRANASARSSELEATNARRGRDRRRRDRRRAWTRPATVHAIGDTCTHGDISLAEGFVEGDTLECWAHGSAFSLDDRQAPQPSGLRAGPRLRRDEIADGDVSSTRTKSCLSDWTRQTSQRKSNVSPRDPRPPRHRRDRSGHQAHPQRRRPDDRTRARPTPSWAPTARASRRSRTRSPVTPSTTSRAARSLLDGDDVLAMTVDERARAGLFLAMQYPVEIPGVTVTNFLRTAKTAIDGEAPAIRTGPRTSRRR